MNKKNVQYSLISLLLMLPGCGRVIDWAKGNFNQGTTFQENTEIQKKFVRSVTVYDQFTTCGMFDVLFLSDEVRALYAQLHARHYGKSGEQYKMFLRRQLEENNHFISFYILSPYDLPFGKADAQWAVFLQIDVHKFSPIELKAVELNPEFKEIFGERFNRFKAAYIAKFAAKTVDDKWVIDANSQNLVLHFRSTRKEAELKWTLNSVNYNDQTV